MIVAANLIQSYPLTLEQRCQLILAPINLKNMSTRAYFLHYLDQYVSGGEVRLNIQLPVEDSVFLSRNVQSLEVKHQALEIYLWLGTRLSTFSFVDMEEALNKREVSAALLEKALDALSAATKGDWWRQKRHTRTPSTSNRKDLEESVDSGALDTASL